MTSRLLSGVLVVILAGFADGGMDTSVAASSDEMKTQVFRYLDSTDADEAARTLQAMLSDPNATIDQAIRIVQTERDYAPQPTGTIPDERVDVQGRAYHLALSVPLTYQPAKGYGLVVCLHGAGFTGEAYLERWQVRLGRTMSWPVRLPQWAPGLREVRRSWCWRRFVPCNGVTTSILTGSFSPACPTAGSALG